MRSTAIALLRRQVDPGMGGEGHQWGWVSGCCFQLQTDGHDRRFGVENNIRIPIPIDVLHLPFPDRLVCEEGQLRLIACLAAGDISPVSGIGRLAAWLVEKPLPA